MKISRIAITAFIAMLTQPAFAACGLDASDFAALALSKSHLQSQAQVDALDARRQDLVCRQRSEIRQFHAAGNQINFKPSLYSPYYLSPDEVSAYTPAYDAWFTAHLP